MKPKTTLRNFLAAIGASMVAISSASAQLTWDANGTSPGQTDGGGAWLGNDLWWDGLTNLNWISGSDAIFGNGGTGGNVTLASPTTAESITFNSFSGTYNLGTSGQALTINSGITMNAGASAVTLTSPIVLGGAQSWLNNASNNETRLFVNSAVNNGGFDLTIGGSAVTADRNSANVQITGIISGSGGLLKEGPGVLWLQGANNYTGATTVTGGVLRNQSGNLSGMTSGLITLNGGVLESYWSDTFTRSLGDGTNPNEIQLTGGASGFSAHGAGNGAITVRLNNDATTAIQWGSTDFNPTTLVLQSIYANTGSSLTFQNALDLNGAQRTIEVNQGADFSNVRATMSGVLSNSAGTAAGITKTGDGTLILTNNSNSYDGPTIVEGGVLQIGTAHNAGNLSVPGGYTSNPTTGSNLELNGGIVSFFFSFNRSLGDGDGQVQLTGGRSGFTQKQGDRVDLTFGNAATEVVWGSTHFNPTTLVLNDSAAAPATVLRFNNALDLNGANRTVFTDGAGPAATNGASVGAFSRVLERGALFAGNIQNSDTGDTAGIIKTGSALLGFTGTNTYNGGTDVQEGGVFFHTVNSMPASGAVSLANSTSLVVSVGGSGWSTGTSGEGTIGGLLAGLGGQAGSTVSYTGNVTLGLNVASGTQTYSGDIANATGSTSTGLGIYSSGGTGIMELTGNNTYTGGTTLNTGGTLAIDSANAIGSGALTFAGGTLQSSDSTALTIANSIVLGGNVGIGGTGDVTFSDTSNTQVSDTNNTTRTFNIGSGVTATFNQTFTANGNNGITMTGDGVMALTSANNSYTRATTIGGTLEVTKLANGGQNSSIGRSGSAANQLQFNNGGVLRYVGDGDSTDRLFRFNQNADGGITFDASGTGALNFTNTGSPTFNNNRARTLNLTGSNTGLNTMAATLIDNNATNLLSVNKDGDGTWVLTGASTYTGGTLVQAGTLLVNNSSGSGTGSGTVTVNAGATLGGTGIIAGATTISGTHSPGNSPGIQTFESDLSYTVGSNVVWELVDNTTAGRGTNFDGIDVGGVLEFAGLTTLDLSFNFSGSAVDWTNGFWATSHTGTAGWLIYDGATDLIGFENLNINTENWLDGLAQSFDSIRGSDYFFSLHQDGNDIYLNYNVIPEPKTALLGAIGFLMLLRRRR